MAGVLSMLITAEGTIVDLHLTVLLQPQSELANVYFRAETIMKVNDCGLIDQSLVYKTCEITVLFLFSLF